MKVTVNGKSLDDMTPAERAAFAARGKKRLAEMFASGQPPRAETDDTYRANAGNCNGAQFEHLPAAGDYYKKIARRAGVSTTGKTYLSALAKFPGDPRAWVSGKGDIKRVAEANGWGCEGAVRVKRKETPPPKPVAVAEDIVRAEVKKELAKNPEQRVEDVREKVIKKRKPHWVK